MKNFLRAMRFAWPYRWRIFISVACALLAAAFWALNFTAIYPVLTILSTEKNLQTWVDDQIKLIQTEKIDPLQNLLVQLTKHKEVLDQQPPSREHNRQLTR